MSKATTLNMGIKGVVRTLTSEVDFGMRLTRLK